MKNEKIISFVFLLFLTCPSLVLCSNEGSNNGMSFEQKLQACSTCHGVDGDKPLAPDYPILAGQHQDYLVNSLHAYKDGRRKHPIMNIQVKVLDLSNSDISKLSQYFSKKQGLKGLGE